MQQPLSDILARTSPGGQTLIDSQYEPDDIDTNDDYFVQQLRTATMLVHECGGADVTDEELLDKVSEWAADLNL